MAYNSGFVLYKKEPLINDITLYVLQMMQDAFIKIEFEYTSSENKLFRKEFNKIEYAIEFIQSQGVKITEVVLATKCNEMHYMLYSLNNINKAILIKFYEFNDEIYDNNLDTPDLKRFIEVLFSKLLKVFIQAQSSLLACVSWHDDKWGGMPDSDEDEFYIVGTILESIDQKNYQNLNYVFNNDTSNVFYLLALSKQYPNYALTIEKLLDNHFILESESEEVVLKNTDWQPIWLQE